MIAHSSFRGRILDYARIICLFDFVIEYRYHHYRLIDQNYRYEHKLFDYLELSEQFFVHLCKVSSTMA